MKKGLLVCGSRSDWDKTVGPFLERPFSVSGPRSLRLSADICSCHRNPLSTVFLALRVLFGGCDFVVCLGGKAFALPGVLDAWIYFFARIFRKKSVPVIAVVLGEPESRALLAAVLSVLEIPGETVLAESKDHAFMGLPGLVEVLRLAENDLLPKDQKPRAVKPAERGIWNNYRK